MDKLRSLISYGPRVTIRRTSPRLFGSACVRGRRPGVGRDKLSQSVLRNQVLSGHIYGLAELSGADQPEHRALADAQQVGQLVRRIENHDTITLLN